MKSRYLVRPTEKEDWLSCTETETELSVCLLHPVGPNAMLEVRDGLYKQGNSEPYHQHDVGSEIFYLREGTVEITIRGLRVPMQAGDMAFIAPGLPHGISFPAKKTVWRVFLQGMDVNQRRENRNRIAAWYPQVWDDPAFCEMFNGLNGSFPCKQPAARAAELSEVPEVRTPSFAWATFQVPGAVLRQVVGRWETGGLYEVWRIVGHKGLRVEWNAPHPNWELYQVICGEVRLTTPDETVTAKPGELLRIPPYCTHSLEVLTDECELADMGCPIRLLNLLEDLRSMEQAGEALPGDPAQCSCLLRRYGCFVTQWQYQDKTVELYPGRVERAEKEPSLPKR